MAYASRHVEGRFLKEEVVPPMLATPTSTPRARRARLTALTQKCWPAPLGEEPRLRMAGVGAVSAVPGLFTSLNFCGA